MREKLSPETGVATETQTEGVEKIEEKIDTANSYSELYDAISNADTLGIEISGTEKTYQSAEVNTNISSGIRDIQREGAHPLFAFRAVTRAHGIRRKAIELSGTVEHVVTEKKFHAGDLVLVPRSDELGISLGTLEMSPGNSGLVRARFGENEHRDYSYEDLIDLNPIGGASGENGTVRKGIEYAEELYSELRNEIRDAHTLQGLFAILEDAYASGLTIKGSGMAHSARDVKEKIKKAVEFGIKEKIEDPSSIFSSVTKAFGLRKKVTDLYSIERKAPSK